MDGLVNTLVNTFVISDAYSPKYTTQTLYEIIDSKMTFVISTDDKCLYPRKFY